MKSDHPVVSVVIPTYNSGTTIIQAIESVFNQSFQELEIIVVDDGSTDDTRSILSDFIEKKEIVYVYQKNQGCGAARNAALKIARGEFAAFLDADDYWHVEKLKMQVDTLMNDKNSIMCYSDAYEVDPFHAVVWGVRQTKSGKLRSGNVLKYLVFRNFITLSSVMVRASVFRQTELFTNEYDLMMFADYDAWLRLAPLGTIRAIETSLVFYQTRLPISRKEKISNHRKILRIFIIRIREAPFKYKHWYVIGISIRMGVLAAHCVLDALGI